MEPKSNLIFMEERGAGKLIWRERGGSSWCYGLVIADAVDIWFLRRRRQPESQLCELYFVIRELCLIALGLGVWDEEGGPASREFIGTLSLTLNI